MQIKLTEEQIQSLPKWVKENLHHAKLIGGSNRTIELIDGRRYLLDNKINELSGTEWTKFICSVQNTRYPTSGTEAYAHKIRRMHPTPKPPQLMKDLIEFFTKSDDIVFDYFMGVGGTLLGASLCGRKAIGIDLNPFYVETYKKASKELGLNDQQTFVGDSVELLSDAEKMRALLCGKQVGMILIDPPYANMMAKEKTGADIKVYGKVATPFSDSPKDLGNMPRGEFMPALKNTIQHALKYLKKKGYLVIFCKDMQPKKKDTHMLHAEIVNSLNEIPGLYYRGLKIWADQSAKLFPYGYPFEFVINQIHQYILVFRKH